MMNSTNETANENFMTDQGSTRFRYSRARRGPRLAAAVTVARALRIASLTRLAGPLGPGPAGPPGAETPGRAPTPTPSGCVDTAGPRAPTVAAPRTLARATVAPAAGATWVESRASPLSDDWDGRSTSGGGAMP